MMPLINEIRDPLIRAVFGDRDREDLSGMDPSARPFATAGSEPSLDDMFADPIVQALMASDGLGRGDVELVLAGARPTIR